MAKDFLGKEIKLHDFVIYVDGSRYEGGHFHIGTVTNIIPSRIYIKKRNGSTTYKTDFNKLIVLEDSYKLKYKMGLNPENGEWK